MANNHKNPDGKDHSWNFLATLFFLCCVVALGYALNKSGMMIEKAGVLELLIMSLATYRLTRILVFDKIFKLMRDFIRSRARLRIFYVIREIITCPWCAGVWVAPVIVALYYLVPYGRLLVYLLAISGIASFFVIFVNNIGLSTEEKQQRIHKVREDSDYSKPE